ncbi:hypothetical protein [Nocardia caishijiensis]|uniref:Uncharacterized protein n=1 Tax=Nocardia caishijiensis TaxID=184756 RepID=A0ABQ6YJP0_9NOCA|nr:hypothetical protein [Nocardia caishijiensis]KAF0845719.1 hypothetical protein FNL39_106106 [Nocardia caishijiensis]
MTPRDRFLRLDADRRRQVHLVLCAQALPTWTGYVRGKPAALRYRDSVVGMRHRVDVDLPADALRAVRTGADRADVSGRYLEPIAALHDDDLCLPDHVEFAYYAIYNCFRRYVCGDDIAEWLIVDQALAAHDPSEATPRLTRAVDDVDPGTSGTATSY